VCDAKLHLQQTGAANKSVSDIVVISKFVHLCNQTYWLEWCKAHSGNAGHSVVIQSVIVSCVKITRYRVQWRAVINAAMNAVLSLQDT